MPKVDRLLSLLPTVLNLMLDAWRFIRLSLQPRCTLAAEILFLRKQLALYLERRIEPRRPGAAAKLTLVLLSRLFPWRQALTIVKPGTFIGKAFDCSGSGNRGPAGGLAFLPNSRN